MEFFQEASSIDTKNVSHCRREYPLSAIYEIFVRVSSNAPVTLAENTDCTLHSRKIVRKDIKTNIETRKNSFEWLMLTFSPAFERRDEDHRSTSNAVVTEEEEKKITPQYQTMISLRYRLQCQAEFNARLLKGTWTFGRTDICSNGPLADGHI